MNDSELSTTHQLGVPNDSVGLRLKVIHDLKVEATQQAGELEFKAA